MTSCRGLQPRLRALADEDCVLEDRPAITEHLGRCASCRALLHTYQTTRQLAAEIAGRMPVPAGLEERVREAVLAPPPAPEPVAEAPPQPTATVTPDRGAAERPTRERPTPERPAAERSAPERPAPPKPASVRSVTEAPQQPQDSEGRSRTRRPGRSRRGGRRRRHGRPGPGAGSSPQV